MLEYVFYNETLSILPKYHEDMVSYENEYHLNID